MFFYHAAADVQVGVQFLCNSPHMKTMFRMFRDMLEQCHNTMALRSGSRWFGNIVREKEYPWPKTPMCMLCLDECKTFFRYALADVRLF